MSRSWTFGQKIGAGFAVVVGLSVLMGFVAVLALRSTTASKDRAIEEHLFLLSESEALSAAASRRARALLEYVITKDRSDLLAMENHRAEAEARLAEIRAYAAGTPEQKAVESIAVLEAELQVATSRLVALRDRDAPMEELLRAYKSDTEPKRLALREALDPLIARQRESSKDTIASSNLDASRAVTSLVALALVSMTLAVVIAIVLTRALSRQIGTAVSHVQSSATELQASANQQATSTREQAAAMNEISTTMSELLATSRQIADGAQRVAHAAAETTGAARGGDVAVDQAREAVDSIRRQVDLIVGHMLDLGKKSQQIGGVLEVVAELAEQTNILAINATIEAAGAGDAGRRFAVVADEIRKLADRVGGSTKEIRGLIEDVRSAVNTTVMATESGSKAVDLGARQFGEVAASFKKIAGMVAAATDAAREIELSTKQQSTAVEQVNVAVANVTQATRETEAGSSQTLLTAGQLSDLSRGLSRLVRQEKRRVT